MRVKSLDRREVIFLSEVPWDGRPRPPCLIIAQRFSAGKTRPSMIPVPSGTKEALAPTLLAEVQRFQPCWSYPRSKTLFGNDRVLATLLPTAKQSFRDNCVPKQSLGTRWNSPQISPINADRSHRVGRDAVEPHAVAPSVAAVCDRRLSTPKIFISRK
jgi:hypothetical protein